MKNKILLLISCITLGSLTGCGAKLPDEPGKEVVEADIQEYIQELIDSDAEIQYLQESDSIIENDELSITCVVSYSSEEIAYRDEFLITYEVSDKEWELSKCRVNSDYSEKSKESLVEIAEVTEETTETSEEESVVEESSEESVSHQTGTVQMSDNLEDFTFELEGIVYQLPVKYSVLKENGWHLDVYHDESEDDEILANSYEFYNITNGIVSLNVDIINMSGDVRMMKDCSVGAISIDTKNNLDFKMAKGITGLSTVDEIQEAFGIPSSSNAGNGYQSLTYKVADYQAVRFYIDEEHSANNNIVLQCYKMTEDDVVEIKDEVPEYFASYVAPKVLGDAVTDTIFELDGVLYRLPCPISEFINNGWKISSANVENVGAGNREFNAVILSKDNYKFNVGLWNYGKKAAYLHNCAVYDVSFYSNYMEGAPADYVKFSGGLCLGSTFDEVDQVCGEFTKNDYDDYASFTYNSSDYTEKVWYSVYKETSNYSNTAIELKNEIWNY